MIRIGEEKEQRQNLIKLDEVDACHPKLSQKDERMFVKV
jgi:hypothetical protein